jgi:hypothetical protein
VGRSHQRCSSSQREGISPSYLRPPSSGAGTNLGASGRTAKTREDLDTRLSLRLRMSHFAIAATHELGQRCILGFATNRKEHR